MSEALFMHSPPALAPSDVWRRRLKKGSNKRKKQIYCQGRGSVDGESCWAKNLQSLLFLQEESIWLWGAGGLTGNFQIWNMNAHAICVLDCVCIQRKEKGEKCAYDISKLPVAECKTIFTKTLRTMCCLLMHRQHNHTQCICAGRVHWAPRLIPHKTMRSHSGQHRDDALQHAFTCEQQSIVANVP